MHKRTALIVIDSGFSMKSLADADQVVAFRDLVSGRSAVATRFPAEDEWQLRSEIRFLSKDELRQFASDPLNHGSIVLERLRELYPDSPLVLIRAVDDNGDVVRTGWSNGQISRDGWTEAYLWAVTALKNLGYQASVANCSFGGIVGAMDGTGWESFQLAKVTGAGKPGQVVVAAAGRGDGSAVHASWLTGTDSQSTVDIYQAASTTYSLWAATKPEESGWRLEVRAGEQLIAVHHGADNPLNMWNGRQLLTFTIDGEGRRNLVLRRGSRPGVSSALKLDCFATAGDAWFLNHVDPKLVSEPAVFPHVVAVGLKNANYSPRQNEPGEKPDVLLDGEGPISFRTPEVTAFVAKLLEDNPQMSVASVLDRLNKRL